MYYVSKVPSGLCSRIPDEADSEELIIFVHSVIQDRAQAMQGCRHARGYGKSRSGVADAEIQRPSDK